VRRALHHCPRRDDGVARSEDRGDRPGAALAAGHHRRIHLLRTRASENSAPAGIEQRVVLQRDDRRGHRVERTAAAGQNIASRAECAGEPGMEERFAFGVHIAALRRTRPAMDRERKAGIACGILVHIAR